MPPTQPAEQPAWDDWPRPSLAVDVTVLTVEHATERPRLGLLVIRRATSAHKGRWDIPGAFVAEPGTPGRRRRPGAARQGRRDWAGASPAGRARRPRPGRPRLGRLRRLHRRRPVRPARARARQGCPARPRPGARRRDRRGLFSRDVRLPSGQKRLPFDHDDIVRRAVADLQQRYREAPDPDRLVESDEFTLTELYAIHTLITAGEEHRDTFRRRVEPRLSELGVRRLAVGRPAKLYTFDRE